MALRAAPDAIASQARRLYTEELVKGLVGVVQTAIEHARSLQDKPSEHATAQRRRELVQSLMTGAQAWHRGIVSGLRQVLTRGVASTRPGELQAPGARSSGVATSAGGAITGMASFSLVSDDAIELEIVTSRLALAIMDRASWEFADLRSRVAQLEGRNELDPQDMLRAHVLARVVFEAWRSAAQTLEGWRELQPVLHDEFALLVEEAYHEVNRWLMAQGVLPEVDLRPFIRRARTHPNAPLGWQAGTGAGHHSGYGSASEGGAGPASGYGAATGYGGSGAGSSAAGRGNVGEETRMMTRSTPLARSREHAEAVLGRLNRLVGRHVPSFGQSTRSQNLDGPTLPSHALSPGLARASLQITEGNSLPPKINIVQKISANRLSSVFRLTFKPKLFLLLFSQSFYHQIIRIID